MKYWGSGLPVQGLGQSTAGVKYWGSGLPATYYVAAGGGAETKVQVGKATVTFSSQVPTVKGLTTAISVGAAEITLSTFDVAPGLSLIIGTASLVLTGFAPTVRFTIPVGTVSLDLIGRVPTVKGVTTTVLVDNASLVLTGRTPSMPLLVPTASLTLSPLGVMVETGTAIMVPPGDIDFNPKRVSILRGKGSRYYSY